MTFFEDRVARNSLFSPDDAIDDALCEYEDAFRKWWGLDASMPPDDYGEDDWREYQRFDGLAKQIADVGAKLLLRKGLGPSRLTAPSEMERESADYQDRVDQFLQAVKERLPSDDWWNLEDELKPTAATDPRTKFNVFQNCLQLEAARLFPYRLRDVTTRLSQLVHYLSRYTNDRTRAYLNRVAKCYVLDMPTEFAVMTRAVLDTTLEHQFDDEHVRGHFRLGPSERIGLGRRIEFAASIRALDEEWEQGARFINESGDRAAHDTPGLEPNMEKLLEAMAYVLGALHAYLPGEGTR